MKCSTEALQAFLDGEMELIETETLRRHLGCCSVCRQELSRLRLLWLELEQNEEIEIPLELPFIRQQIIAKARAARQETKETSEIRYWDAQKLAWQPLLIGVFQIPGPRLLGRFVKTTRHGLPVVIRGISSMVGIFTGKRSDRR